MAKRPNILIFMTDQQQAQVLAPGHPCITPNADRLAREGVQFTRANCPTAHCCPSRATFFTGLYPSRHGIYNNVSTPTAINRSLRPGVRCFSEDLRDAGYNLAFTGKWHISDTENPADRGWGELNVNSGKGSMMQVSPAEFRQRAASQLADGPRPDGVVQRPGWGDYTLYRTLPDSTFDDSIDAQIVRPAVAAMDDLAAAGKPWCLYIGTLGPHDPFFVPKRFVDLYDPDRIELPPNFHDTLDDKPRIYQRMRKQYWNQLTEREVREAIAHYWGYCTVQDELLGEVLAKLASTGQTNDTLVLLTSDHGDYCGAHGLWAKGVPAFSEAYNIPLIVRWPSGIGRPGRQMHQLVTSADFAPTFLELAGVEPKQTFTGRSIVPLLQDRAPQDWPETFFSQFNGVELYYTQRQVVTPQWKYVYNGFDFDELYDLRTDPHEMKNLVDDSSYESVKRGLVSQMWDFAEREQDRLIYNSYCTVAMTPWGPGDPTEARSQLSS